MLSETDFQTREQVNKGKWVESLKSSQGFWAMKVVEVKGDWHIRTGRGQDKARKVLKLSLYSFYKLEFWGTLDIWNASFRIINSKSQKFWINAKMLIFWQRTISNYLADLEHMKPWAHLFLLPVCHSGLPDASRSMISVSCCLVSDIQM